MRLRYSRLVYIILTYFNEHTFTALMMHIHLSRVPGYASRDLEIERRG